MSETQRPTGGTSTESRIDSARSEVRAQATELVETLRAKTGNAQATIADALDAGATAVRDHAGAPATASAAGSADSGSGRLSVVGDALAGAMERSAMWLRENELADLPRLIGRQIEERPVRTALFAVAVGVLLARSRGND